MIPENTAHNCLNAKFHPFLGSCDHNISVTFTTLLEVLSYFYCLEQTF